MLLFGVVWFENENTTKNHHFYRRKVDSLKKNHFLFHFKFDCQRWSANTP